MLENKTISDLVREMESADTDGITTISKYVEHDHRECLEKIDCYINSKHISGEYDSQGREKPSFNIVTSARNITYRATDMDTKNINILPTKTADTITSFLATVHLREWMRKHNWGQFLNDWGLSLATYGSTILKFVEKDGELFSEVMPWNRMIVDAVDFDSNPRIEKLWLTPSQLLKKEGYNRKMVIKLIDAQEVRETTDGQDKDTKQGYIPVYEVHGELPLSYLTGDPKDEIIYEQQMYVLSFLESKENEDEYDDYVLYSGRESKDPYMITHLIKTDGRTLSIGSVENLFQAQWMQNHSVKVIKDNLDLSSKIIFQTSDGTFVGKNALSDIFTGDILKHAPNAPLTQLNNRADIIASQSNQAQWKQLGDEIVGISGAMRGESAKSGTAWRDTEARLQENHSLFELMTENKGLSVIDMLTTYIIPHVKKKMDTSDEIMATLEEHQIKFVDTKFIPNEAIRVSNAKMKKAILSGKAFDQEQQDEDIRVATEDITSALQSLGNKRSFKPSDVGDKTWKKVFKDLEWQLEYDITGEARDTQVAADTLTKVLQFIANKQGMPMSPQEKLVFDKILQITGAVSPLEMSQVSNSQPQPVASQGGEESATAQQQPTPTQ